MSHGKIGGLKALTAPTASPRIPARSVFIPNDGLQLVVGPSHQFSDAENRQTEAHQSICEPSRQVMLLEQLVVSQLAIYDSGLETH